MKKRVPKPAAAEETGAEALTKFVTTMKTLERFVVGRNVELRAIMYAVLMRQHVLLEGPPGLAKTHCADLVFNAITGVRLYTKQLNSTVPSDRILGPVSTRKFREEDILWHNTTNMLPEAELVILDELGRCPRSLADVLLELLNERRFFNGTTIMQCPLHTCVGTANFKQKGGNEEFEAFYDRYLFQIPVRPLGKDDLRVLLTKETTFEDDERPQIKWVTVKRAHRYLMQQMRETPLSSDDLGHLMNFIDTAVEPMKSKWYVSDRRRVWAAKFAHMASFIYDNYIEWLEDMFMLIAGADEERKQRCVAVFKDAMTAFERVQRVSKMVATAKQTAPAPNFAAQTASTAPSKILFDRNTPLVTPHHLMRTMQVDWFKQRAKQEMPGLMRLAVSEVLKRVNAEIQRRGFESDVFRCLRQLLKPVGLMSEDEFWELPLAGSIHRELAKEQPALTHLIVLRQMEQEGTLRESMVVVTNAASVLLETAIEHELDTP